MSDQNEIAPHSPKQEEAFFSRSKITALITGIQWGKTTSGAAWIRDLISENLKPNSNFLVTAPTYKILEQSTLPAFLKEMEGFGQMKSQKAMFEVDAGLDQANPKVYFRTAKEPDSVVGMTNVYGIWCDEAGKYPLYFWENIQGRSAFKDCPIMITTSPYSMNWIWKDIIKPVREGKRKDVKLIQAASTENPYFPKSVYERNKLTMDPRRFNMMYNGNFDKMQGLVYDCFDEEENQCHPFQLPSGTKFVGGIDWGFTDPFVFKVRAITLQGNHFGVSEYYKAGMTPSEIYEVVGSKCVTFGVKIVYCGPDQPGLIEDLNRHFAKNKIACAAVKADNDRARGIAAHYELLKTRRLKYFRGMNPNTLDEFDTYHYPEPKDLGPDDDSKEQEAVEQNDHAMDCDRYISISTKTVSKHLKPKAPEEKAEAKSPQQRMKQLMKKKNYGQQTENFD